MQDPDLGVHMAISQGVYGFLLAYCTTMRSCARWQARGGGGAGRPAHPSAPPRPSYAPESSHAISWHYWHSYHRHYRRCAVCCGGVHRPLHATVLRLCCPVLLVFSLLPSSAGGQGVFGGREGAVAALVDGVAAGGGDGDGDGLDGWFSAAASLQAGLQQTGIAGLFSGDAADSCRCHEDGAPPRGGECGHWCVLQGPSDKQNGKIVLQHESNQFVLKYGERCSSRINHHSSLTTPHSARDPHQRGVATKTISSRNTLA